MGRRFRRGNISYYDGDILFFPYEGREEKGLLFFNEAERKFMVLLSNDIVVLAEEIGFENFKK